MKHKLKAALAAVAVTACLAAAAQNAPSIAQGEHNHDGQHGGKVVESGHHHLEIVVKDGVVSIHVNGEDGKPEDVKGATGTAAVLADGKKHDIKLTVDPGNFLTGLGDFKASKGATVVVTLTMPGHTAEQARIKLD